MSRIGSKLLVIREAANIIHTEEKGLETNQKLT